jgi:hypothetical protein
MRRSRTKSRQRRPDGRVLRRFARAFAPTESDAGIPFGGVRRHAGTDVLGGLLCDVKLDLFLHPTITIHGVDPLPNDDARLP